MSFDNKNGNAQLWQFFAAVVAEESLHFTTASITIIFRLLSEVRKVDCLLYRISDSQKTVGCPPLSVICIVFSTLLFNAQFLFKYLKGKWLVATLFKFIFLSYINVHIHTSVNR